MMNNHSPTLVHRRYTEPSRGTRLHFANLRDVVRYETFWKSENKKNSRNVSKGSPQ